MKLNYFNFKQIKSHFLLTNDFGEYIFLRPNEFQQLLAKKVQPGTDLWQRLESGRFIYNDSDIGFSSIHRYELQEFKGCLAEATSLHIFVVNTACNLRCVYCQANNGRLQPHAFMTEEIAEKAVSIALQSPAHHLEFEFQGGEPLLNFAIIKYIVEFSEENKGAHEIKYNLVSNLTLMTDEMLEFFVEHHFCISTSIDGPEDLHNANRPFTSGEGSFDQVISAVQKIRLAGLPVGAIETTTKQTLSYPERIVHGYVDMGFDSIFLRPLTPLGKAYAGWDSIGYTAESFVQFYKRAFNELIRINKTGVYIKESHAGIFLKKMQGMMLNYMELRSPCGAGIGQLAYYSDGNIFTCDEGRMLYEMGNNAFQLGSVFSDSYSDLIQNATCRATCASSVLETIPSCCDCAYQPYCGTCPVVNYATTGDLIEKSPKGYRCQIYSGILDTLFEALLEEDPETIQTLLMWSN